MRRWWGTLGTLAIVGACAPDAFFCAEDGQCLQSGVQGTCEPSGVCSFPDDDCDSGRRFGEFAGALANSCVPVQSAGTSGGEAMTSAIPATDGPTSDGAVDLDGTSTGSRPSTSSGGDGSTGRGSSEGDTGQGSGTGGSPNGADCSDPTECASGHCGLLGALGGVCSECTDDADCRWGCAPPNPLVSPAIPGACVDGGLGASCQSAEACQDALVCAQVLDAQGIGTFSSCGECGPGDGCGAGLICNVTLDVGAIAGQRECVAVGSVPNGSTCLLEDGLGELACAEHCATISIMGVVEVGLCGECRDNGDCPGNGTCVAGSIELGGQTTPSACN